MKIWQKIFSMALAVALVCAAVLLLQREERGCCLCDSLRYHAPCLIDLKTGELIELDLYVPHPDLVAELANPQPTQGTFSFIALGSVSGYKDTAQMYLEIHIPASERTVKTALCSACRKQLKDIYPRRYVLADLYSNEEKKLIPVKAAQSVTLRCYRIDVVENESGVLKMTAQGLL